MIRKLWTKVTQRKANPKKIKRTYEERMIFIYKTLAKDLQGAITYQDIQGLMSARTLAWVDEFDSVYRVHIRPNTGRVEVVCLGIDSVDSEAEGIYDNTSTLPMWMQEKLAVLQMMKVDPPQIKVEGVGMRVDRDVYWIIKS